MNNGMRVGYSRTFQKMFKKQRKTVQEKFTERLEVFVCDPHCEILKNHALRGEWRPCRSINITGDIRAVYEEISEGQYEFVAIGSHSELYS